MIVVVLTSLLTLIRKKQRIKIIPSIIQKVILDTISSLFLEKPKSNGRSASSHSREDQDDRDHEENNRADLTSHNQDVEKREDCPDNQNDSKDPE